MSLLPPKGTITQAKATSPALTLIISPPKMGKTTAAAALTLLTEDALLIDCEPREGSKFVDARKVSLEEEDEMLSNLEKLSRLKAICKEIEDAKRPYRYLIIDSVTALQDMMTDFCIQKCKDTGDTEFAKTKDLFRMNRGKGWVMLRVEFGHLLGRLSCLAKHVIFIGHVKDKEIYESETVDEVTQVLKEKAILKVSANVLDLYGQIRANVMKTVDLAGVLTKITLKDDKGAFKYENGKPVKDYCMSFVTDEISSGSRLAKLNNKTFIFNVMEMDKETKLPVVSLEKTRQAWGVIFPELLEQDNGK